MQRATRLGTCWGVSLAGYSTVYACVGPLSAECNAGPDETHCRFSALGDFHASLYLLFSRNAPSWAATDDAMADLGCLGRGCPPPSHPAPRTPSERSASVFTVTVRTPSSTVRGIECAVRSHDEILYHICCCCCYVCTPPVRPQAIRGRASVFKSLLNTVIPERSPPRAARTNAQCHSFC